MPIQTCFVMRRSRPLDLARAYLACLGREHSQPATGGVRVAPGPNSQFRTTEPLVYQRSQRSRPAACRRSRSRVSGLAECRQDTAADAHHSQHDHQTTHHVPHRNCPFIFRVATESSEPLASTSAKRTPAPTRTISECVVVRRFRARDERSESHGRARPCRRRLLGGRGLSPRGRCPSPHGGGLVRAWRRRRSARRRARAFAARSRAARSGTGGRARRGIGRRGRRPGATVGTGARVARADVWSDGLHPGAGCVGAVGAAPGAGSGVTGDGPGAGSGR